MRHAQAQVAIPAVFQAEHVRAHDVPTAGFLPDFGGVQGREQHLLSADAVHFLPDDLRDLEQRSLGQKQIAIDSGGQLAYIAGSQQELVADDFSFGGGFPQGGDEKFAPLHEGSRCGPIFAAKPFSSLRSHRVSAVNVRLQL